MNKILRHTTSDAVCVLGALSVIYGVWRIYPPACWIIGGLAVIWSAFAILRDV